ncbi:MAG TPA: DUF3866 family protein, partial [Thermaerobacter sp.]
VYVMTDGGALPAALSRLLATLRERGWVAWTVTAGQAFGGDDEAAHLASALLVARVRGARLIVAGMGPGILGTGETLGHTGLDQAWILSLAHGLGGRPVLVPRLSGADGRPRQRGLSHHTAGVLGILPRPAWLALPRPLPAAAARPLNRLAAAAGVLPVGVYTGPALAWWRRQGLDATTMGRGPDQDPLFFQAALAAGILAAVLAGAPQAAGVGPAGRDRGHAGRGGRVGGRIGAAGKEEGRGDTP